MYLQGSKPMVTVAAVFIAVMSIGIATRCSSVAQASGILHASDCMRNPFASGCRGISAKRSLAPTATTDLRQSPDSGDSGDVKSGLYQYLATNFVHGLALAPPRRVLPVAKTRQAQAFAEARQMLGSIETLVESASGLVTLCVEHQLAQSSVGARRTSCNELFAPQAGLLLRRPRAAQEGTQRAGGDQEQTPESGRARDE